MRPKTRLEHLIENEKNFRALSQFPGNDEDTAREMMAHGYTRAMKLVEILSTPALEVELIAGQTNQLSKSELAVLFTLDKSDSKLLSIVEIEAEAALSDRTVKTAIGNLISDGIVHRPKGKRKGVTLTTRGKSLAKKLRDSA